MTASRVEVEPDGLLLLADRLRAAATTLRGGQLLDGARAAVGDPALAVSLHRFDTTWGRVRAEVDDDLVRLADTLALVAEAYREAERRSAGRFGLIRDWFGR